uniref:Uncharacterized protein n=1 Tax=Rhizophora mucronata TaxID=61149 RepID=A0A2P2NLE1_RHIMU
MFQHLTRFLQHILTSKKNSTRK